MADRKSKLLIYELERLKIYKIASRFGAWYVYFEHDFIANSADIIIDTAAITSVKLLFFFIFG